MRWQLEKLFTRFGETLFFLTQHSVRGAFWTGQSSEWKSNEYLTPPSNLNQSHAKAFSWPFQKFWISQDHGVGTGEKGRRPRSTIFGRQRWNIQAVAFTGSGFLLLCYEMNSNPVQFQRYCFPFPIGRGQRSTHPKRSDLIDDPLIPDMHQLAGKVEGMKYFNWHERFLLRERISCMGIETELNKFKIQCSNSF